LIELLKTSDLDGPKWEALLAASPNATFFHTLEWARLWEEGYPFFESFFLVKKNADGSYRAGLPFVKAKKLLTGYYSMPMGSYGGAVGEGDLTGLYRRWLEITTGIKRERLAVSSPLEILDLGRLGFHQKKLSTQVVEGLAGSPIEKGWSAKTKSEFKYALASGLSLRPAVGSEDAHLCFELAARKRKGFYTVEFFQNLYRLLAPTGRLLWLAAWEKECLAGFQIYFLYKREAFYWNAAVDPRFSKLRPGYFLFQHFLAEAREKNIERLNLGATPEGAAGVRFFKTRVGGRETPVYEYILAPALKKAARALYEKVRSRK
jgi:hypothetical protein